MNIGQYNASQYGSRPTRYVDARASSVVSAVRESLISIARRSITSCNAAITRLINSRRQSVSAPVMAVSRLASRGLRAASSIVTFDARTTEAKRTASNAKASEAWQLPRELDIGRHAIATASLLIVDRLNAMILSAIPATSKVVRASVVQVNTLTVAVSSGAVDRVKRGIFSIRNSASLLSATKTITVARIFMAMNIATVIDALSIVDRWIATVRPTVIRLEFLITRIMAESIKSTIFRAFNKSVSTEIDTITVIVKRNKTAAYIVNEREQ